MSFHQEYIDRFLSIFEKKKELIRNSSGCRLLELYREKQDSNVFFTYSFWEREEDLEAYRKSEIFKETWAQTNILFNDKPEAWSVDKVVSLQ
jgi:heme-degrading monooxygenase HmoA